MSLHFDLSISDHETVVCVVLNDAPGYHDGQNVPVRSTGLGAL